MPSGFADSFWSPDYAGGLGKLFAKLQQGVVENQQILAIAHARAEAEDIYGDKLKLIPGASEKPNGFGKDDGATVKKAFEGLKKEMDQAGESHRKIAENIRKLVIDPFAKWCDAHEQRVEMSHEDLQQRVRNHDKQVEAVKKLRSNYFNKCRLLEDFEEENKYAFQTPEKQTAPAGAAGASGSPDAPEAPQIKLHEAEEEEDSYEIGDMFYAPPQLKQIISDALEKIPQKEVKVTLLGTYQHCSNGSDITQFIQDNLGATTVSAAERIGQDLVGHGFLRLIGSMGSTFANSTKLNYQWRPKAFDMAGKGLQRKPTLKPETDPLTPESPGSTGMFGEMFSNLISNPRPGETAADRMKREANEADERYRQGVKKLDLIRCNLEEAMMDHLKFMERCETDRLKAIKAVILDFSGATSNVIPALQSTVDTMMLFQETVQPTADLRYLLDNYRTGSFLPKVTTYESYYNSAGDQTFGVDLELRARGDRKRVPIIVTSILQYLDNHYPDLETDEARRNIWTVEVPLQATHHLRNSINNGQTVPRDTLEKYDMPIVASALKLYLLELPDSLVSSRVYDVIKTIYNTHGGEDDDQTRLSVIQNTLGGLLLANIATLDAIVSHFARLLELTSADEQYITDLSATFAPCILRPRLESSITQHDKHAHRLFKDLITHKESIFGELKRERSMNAGRQRALSSTDESQRRANVEARNRAVIARSRPSSPAPNPNSRRRDSSRGGDFPRIPINPTSPTNNANGPGPSQRYRQSLEVPNSSGPLQPDLDPQQAQYVNESSSHFSQTAEQLNTGDDDESSPQGQTQSQYYEHETTPGSQTSVHKMGSVGRSGRGYQPRRAVRPSQHEHSSGERVGVSLSDKPMD